MNSDSISDLTSPDPAAADDLLIEDALVEVVELSLDRLEGCQKILKYQFRETPLLLRCLTHASAARTRLESNERLEFLGDAILGAVVCEMLYEMFPESSEGELTRIKSVVVSRTTCARVVQDLGLQEYLILGKGISTHVHVPTSILATAFEALIGGVYLDGGYAMAREFVRWVIAEDVFGAAESAIGVNYKSLFQQRTQRLFGETPLYRVLDERGPDHSKCFQVAAVVGVKNFSPAWGSSKKIAEQRAAHNALCELDGEPVPHDDSTAGE
ncbi:ribonuclease III [Planctomicrobium piriforme]|uniref:Ribonuclease 3 n=1 Tax=Planctomicrobium piriforme TaxID=1576369 RepID=A0A1I3BES7_9PLAN|nr:ribonuclease III [Planctomicrobium piriforme]SFH60221.1 ribonuclease-3 [Planctomicrobium piriforme]